MIKILFASVNEEGAVATKFEKSNDRYYFTGSGRVDNRQELKQILSVTEVSDTDLLWLSFLKWGQNAPTHILGDWSFAVYDIQEKALFIARDQHGYTALYYTQIGSDFYFSSSIKRLLSIKKPTINEKLVVGRITLWGADREANQTDFEGIFSLLAGHCLRYKNGTLSVTQYWFPENVPLRNYKNHADYSVELFEIFKEAVACRLIGNKPVASMLSGGLDSGSVASMAALILQKEQKSLTTFSHVPLFKDKVSSNTERTFFDETDNILATAGFHQNINPVLLNSEAISPITGLNTFLEINEYIIHGAANAYWMFDVCKTASDNGFGAILSGENGNGALSNAGLPNLLSLLHPSLRNNPKVLLKQFLRPLYRKIKPENNKQFLDFKDYLSNSFLNQHIIDEYQILEDVQNNKSGFGAKNYQSAKEAMTHLLTLARVGRCANGGNVSHYFNIEKRDPTADIRVLEYCLSVPNEAFISEKGFNRNVVRKMMEGVMAHNVLYERKIGRQSADIYYRVLAHRAEMDETLSRLFKNPYFCHFFNSKSITNFWERMKAEQEVVDYQINSLMKAVMTGLFFERNEF